MLSLPLACVDVPYRGEGLPNITYKVLLALLRRKERMYLHSYEKHELLEQAEYQCALCGEREAFEWDHVIPLSTSFGEQRFQPICRTCHAQKSNEEPRELEQDVLASHFNQRVWELDNSAKSLRDKGKHVMRTRPTICNKGAHRPSTSRLAS